MLINTSFNTHGRPIINRASEAVELLMSTEGDGELDHVVVEDWLFSRRKMHLR